MRKLVNIHIVTMPSISRQISLNNISLVVSLPNKKIRPENLISLLNHTLWQRIEGITLLDLYKSIWIVYRRSDLTAILWELNSKKTLFLLFIPVVEIELRHYRQNLLKDGFSKGLLRRWFNDWLKFLKCWSPWAGLAKVDSSIDVYLDSDEGFILIKKFLSTGIFFWFLVVDFWL